MRDTVKAIYRKVSATEELAFYIGTTKPLSAEDVIKLEWLVSETYAPENTSYTSFFKDDSVVEIGPRLQIESPFSSNAVSICRNIEMPQVFRFEYTRRYRMDTEDEDARKQLPFDKMTEEFFKNGIETFDIVHEVEDPLVTIDLIGRGMSEFEKVLAREQIIMDGQDVAINYDAFVHKVRRNPTVEEPALTSNTNSEHSRHGFWNGNLEINGTIMPETLMDLAKKPLKSLEGKRNKSLVAFKDNSGVLEGFDGPMLVSFDPAGPSVLGYSHRRVHFTCTAETHCHPTKVSPYEGAQTGVGGRERDNPAVGGGAMTGFGVAGYFVGGLFPKGYQIPGERVGKGKRGKYSSPLEQLMRGSDGAASYPNQYGEPTIGGWCRNFNQMIDGEWYEPRKPTLWSGGVGMIFDQLVKKQDLEVGDVLVRIGGKVRPVGVNGGAASSSEGPIGENLEYNSVQRGEPSDENAVNRAIRAATEFANIRIFKQITDMGAGGIGNAFTELVSPLGGGIDLAKLTCGDKTMTRRQKITAETQESYAAAVPKAMVPLLKTICWREGTCCDIVGYMDGAGHITMVDTKDNVRAIDLNLKTFLENLPRKTFKSTRKKLQIPPLELNDVKLEDAIDKVLRILSVGSKAFLVHKKDRAVTGRVAQQQCCGIAQIAIADNQVGCMSYEGFQGVASSIGENPNRILINGPAGVRMCMGEALTNMASVLITDPRDIRYRGNWIWPAKRPHEGARHYDAVKAMSDFSITLTEQPMEVHMIEDGGKDSLSPTDEIEGELAKAPGQFIAYAYAPVPDVRKKITPDIKKPGESYLYLVDLGQGKNRLGGSALAQAYEQLGDTSPDVDDPALLTRAFHAVQTLVRDSAVLSIHDRSDGGLFTAVTEMCMASRCGYSLYVDSEFTALSELFSEELGFVLEVGFGDEDHIVEFFNEQKIPIKFVGITQEDSLCEIRTKDAEGDIYSTTIENLRVLWEKTSHVLNRLQTNPVCADAEHETHGKKYPGPQNPPNYKLTFEPKLPPLNPKAPKIRVAIIREKGSNSDREMAASCIAGGMEPVDVCMNDLLMKRTNLDDFQGICFVGGFSHMDVFESAKGWAATILFNKDLREMFDRFYNRPDTFALGVCNGCQLMALLGWVHKKGIDAKLQPRFIHNKSGRFESRWVNVVVNDSPAIMLQGMQGSIIPVWDDHGEGQMFCKDASTLDEIVSNTLAPLSTVDPFGNPTEEYPWNPNGSPYGITALCDPSGRFLAMMTHIERGPRMELWPWKPQLWEKYTVSPCVVMFANARVWAEKQQLTRN